MSCTDLDPRASGYRMIALDLDGTLLSPGSEVTPRTRSAVRACLDAGYVVCFATGRNHTESRLVIEAVGHFDAAVFVGGAMVIDTQTGLTLHRTAMEPALAAAVCGEIEAAGHTALALQDTAAAGFDYLLNDGSTPHASFAGWIQAMRVRHAFAPAVAEPDAHRHTVRVGAVVPNDDAPTLERRLTETFGERIFLTHVRVPYGDVSVIEVFDPSVNKWQGLLRVAETRGIDPAANVAVGDDLNDLHMIRHAGLGVAMGNARPEVKAVARRVIGRNADDGLAIFLEELAADMHQGR